MTFLSKCVDRKHLLGSKQKKKKSTNKQTANPKFPLGSMEKIQYSPANHIPDYKSKVFNS